jgi:outer membrane cobalamin receptor
VKIYSFVSLAFMMMAAGLFAQSGEMPIKQIPEVTVIKNNRDFFSDDQITLTLNNRNSMARVSQNLGYLLEHETPAMVKSYGGPGSLVSLSLHGTGSNHTQVSWNGFPLNSPTTGQADLSLIPAAFMQSVELINGASGALFGSGTFGGSVNMGNKPDWNNRLAVEYSLHTGSFGSLGNLLTVRSGGRTAQYHLGVISNQSESDYTYRDIYRYKSPLVKSVHNSYKSFGIIQNLYLNLGSGNYLEAGMWYQQKTKEIPPLMGSYKESNARQRDSTFRSYISYKRATEKSLLIIRSAWFSDLIAYTDKFSRSDPGYSVYSRISTGRFMNEASYRYYLNSSFTLGTGVTYNYLSGNSNNYGERITEQEIGIFGNLKFQKGNWIVNAGIRKEFYEMINPQLQYSGGLRFRVSDRLILRSSVSSKFRKPTFNEKYWIPGGNVQLNPERGWGGELSGEWLMAGNKESWWIETCLTAYYQHVDNWIQWVVRDSLTPVEYKKVNGKGLEIRLNGGFPTGAFKLTGSMMYGYNRSFITETYDHNDLFVGNQLMYVPVHLGRVNLQADYRGFVAGGCGMYSGMRETVETADEALRMPAYALMDLYAGVSRDIRTFQVGLYFRTDNVFNTQYQAIRSYPMPGRSFLFTLTVGFTRPVTVF